VGKVIDEMLKPIVKEAEHNIGHGLKEPPDPNLVKNKKKCAGNYFVKKGCRLQNKRIHRKDFQTNEEFLHCLKKMEATRFPYMAPMQPVDPEEQKRLMMVKYQAAMKTAKAKFTLKIEKRYMCLIKSMSITQLSTYPSHLIRKAFRLIGFGFGLEIEVLEYLQREEKFWPHLTPEIILMDYMFVSDLVKRKDRAILIMVCLIDLQEDFRYHVKRAFLNYLLGSNMERKRLQLEQEPPDFPIFTIISPVPWRSNLLRAKSHIGEVLMITHPTVQAINRLWHDLYEDLVVVDMAQLLLAKRPLDADTVQVFIKQSCANVRDLLLNDWLPRCADLMNEMRNTWKDMVPMSGKYGGRAAALFRCIHAAMSRHLNSLISKSINYLFKVLCAFKEGNRIDKYSMYDSKLKRIPLVTLVASVVGAHFDHEPIDMGPGVRSATNIYVYDEDDADPFQQPQAHMLVETAPDIDDVAQFELDHSHKLYIYPYMQELPRLFVDHFKSILAVGYDIPRLEYVMSGGEPETHGYLHYIDEDHTDFMALCEKVEQIVQVNWRGVHVYLKPVYKYYFGLFNKLIMPMVEKVWTENILPELGPVMELLKKLQAVSDTTYYLRDFIPLNLFMLDNRHVKLSLRMYVREIYDFIIDFYKALNWNENRAICEELEEMSMKAGERPEETPEVVALQNYINECREMRIFAIKDEIKNVLKRVVFLLTHTYLSSDELHLNSRTFILPGELEEVLDLSAARLAVVRDNLEMALRERRMEFEKLLAQEKRTMDGFRIREIRDVLTLDELKERVDTVDLLFTTIENLSREAKAINIEEVLLQIDVSAFPLLAEIIEKMEPIEKLWKTSYEFEKDYLIWMFERFECLNADGVREQVENMHKIIYKLSRQLAYNPVAKRAAEQVRMKIEKFRVYLPVLDSICRHGLEKRHWDQISKIMGRKVNPKLFPTLKDMIDVDIMSILPQLEEIANAAGKEYDLNNGLRIMQSDWKDVMFEIIQYRDSDTHILASIDDIQTLLDDHIMRTQAMKRSPFIVALGSKADDWEARLLLIQNIIDAWTQVQITWMYLEPIFSSEDIMRQMPLEGRNFKAVDKLWRKIMKHTLIDRHVMAATEYPEMLEIFTKAIEDLETVQKGLNTYLEQKRLFFARFFFLSNDELLEILSETKDPMRVQPHLRKCFEGIGSLNFDEQMEITEMISDEEERVALVRKINPQAANGLVEIWLKEVEMVMLDSVKEQMHEAWEDYAMVERISWVVSWPGQVVQGISCMAWTYEVEEAIETKTLPAYLEKSNLQIADLVQLVRTDLQTGVRIAVEALIVLDVHGRSRGCHTASLKLFNVLFFLTFTDRDVVKYLTDIRISNIQDFDWISQLRYYWKVNDKNEEWVCVSMVVTDVQYGMEYLGNLPRLVVTPLTDRCYRTLMGALKLCLGGAPEGPAGTGKTETCKDLAKAVAKKCVVFNCSDGLDYKALGKFFKVSQ
ncbi:hypothetical protein KR026_003917, partial [Drosophila bipectinata]